jgi:SAM-dependent methyltransferase
VRQPTRSKRVVPERRFDRTQLHVNQHGRTVHRDYWSHVLRWHFVVDQLNYTEQMMMRYGWTHKHIEKGMSILDIGCGQDQPLLYVLGARIQTVPEVYVGIDLNPIRRKSNVKWADIKDQYDFVNYGKKLENIFYLLRPGGILYLSTPVFDGLAAANHIHEYTIPELKTHIEKAGFEVKKRYGTFASKPDIRRAMAGNPERLKVYDELAEWFGGEVMAGLMAPLYPDSSRNNMWICQKPEVADAP